MALTPIVWQHYILLLLAPLAVVRPRFSPIWLLPILLWVNPAEGNGSGVQPFLPALVTVCLAVVILGRPRAAAGSGGGGRARVTSVESLGARGAAGLVGVQAPLAGDHVPLRGSPRHGRRGPLRRGRPRRSRRLRLPRLLRRCGGRPSRGQSLPAARRPGHGVRSELRLPAADGVRGRAAHGAPRGRRGRARDDRPHRRGAGDPARSRRAAIGGATACSCSGRP